MNLQSWILATRPKTLVATISPVLCGTFLAALSKQKNPDVDRFLGLSQLRWDLLIWALLATASLQIATNFINDAVDHFKGSDGAQRLGPTRASSAGLLPAKKVYQAGLFMLLLAFVFGIPLIQERGYVVLVIGLVSMWASYAYTAGPFPLAYRALGDLFVLVFFGWIAVCGSYFLQTGFVDVDVLVASTQVGLLATGLIAINNLRDIDEDRKNKKHTLASVFGKLVARIEIAMCLILPFVLGIYWLSRHQWLFFAPLLAFPFARYIVFKVLRNEPGRIYNKFLAQTAVLNLFFALLFVGAVLFSLSQEKIL